MSSSAPHTERIPFRMKPRRTSVIVPYTAERIHVGEDSITRNYTLRTSDSSFQTPVTEETPLFHDRNPTNTIVIQHCLIFWTSITRTIRTVGRNKNTLRIIKCTIAYFLGSLATFVPFVSSLLGKNDGKHMVATIAVYFHPARTTGSMVEAMIYATAALIYSTLISILSMITAWFFDSRGLIEIGYAIILICFCAGGLGLVAWIKQRMSSPTVSVACSLASISIISILTREGNVQMAHISFDKIQQNVWMVLMAIIVSTAVCVTLWPSSARTELRGDIIRFMGTYETMLSTITRSFLTGSEDILHHPSYLRSSTTYRSVFNSLNKQLGEAKYEYYLTGRENEYIQHLKLVDCIQELSQHIGGLQLASKAQIALLKVQSLSTPGMEGSYEADGEDADTDVIFTPPIQDEFDNVNRASIPGNSYFSGPESPAAIFEQFLFHLGPPMKSLVYTLKLILQDLPVRLDQERLVSINPRFKESLTLAIPLYTEARSSALDTLYQSLKVVSGPKDREHEWAADAEEIAGCCGYFSYCLEAFAEEMIVLLDILHLMETSSVNSTRTWKWLQVSIRNMIWYAKAGEPPQDLLQLPKRSKTVPNIDREKPIPFTYKIWRALKTLRNENVQFGLKVGIGAALYALLAFLPGTRPMFMHWRGEWGLVSYMIVISMTIGQTNSSGILRIVGTIIGAMLAVVGWIVFPENPYALSIYGCVIALPCFHIILNWKQNTFGRFILLTYNLSCLYAYSLSTKDNDDDDDEGGVNPFIKEIAFHRVVSVVVGVLWGLFISRWIWPISARLKLRNGLSVLWLRMALIWSRDPLLSTVEGESTGRYMGIGEERGLQKALLRLSSLTSQAPSEFRLKGPFPTREYQALVTANQSILDACHGMSMMINKDPVANARETEVLNFTSKERSDLNARISHLFYVLASSIRLGFPLPENLPNTIRARDRFLAKLYSFRERIKGEEGNNDENFDLLYAYILVVGQITDGLHECIKVVGNLYGVLEEEMLEI